MNWRHQLNPCPHKTMSEMINDRALYRWLIWAAVFKMLI